MDNKSIPVYIQECVLYVNASGASDALFKLYIYMRVCVYFYCYTRNLLLKIRENKHNVMKIIHMECVFYMQVAKRNEWPH